MANESCTLLALMEGDKEALLSEIRANQSPDAAEQALERALDRAQMRYAEACDDDATRQAAQMIVRTLKSSVTLVDSVGEARNWNRAAGEAPKKRMKPLALGLLAAAGLLELAVLLALMLTGGRMSGPIVFLEALLPAALGVGAAFWSGLITGRPEKKPGQPEDIRQEFLIDADKLWRNLRGMLLIADDALEKTSAEAEVQRQVEALPGNVMERRETDLFATLLESAYAQNNPDAQEMVEAMRFYLHGQGVEAVDYAKGREAWFEFLPGDRPGTLRPALISGDRVVKKGLAAR